MSAHPRPHARHLKRHALWRLSAEPGGREAALDALRRRRSVRLAWGIALTVVLVYGLGFLIPR